MNYSIKKSIFSTYQVVPEFSADDLVTGYVDIPDLRTPAVRDDMDKMLGAHYRSILNFKVVVIGPLPMGALYLFIETFKNAGHPVDLKKVVPVADML